MGTRTGYRALADTPPRGWTRRWTNLYSLRTADKAPDIGVGDFLFLQVLQGKEEPTSGLEPLTCSSYELGEVRSQLFLIAQKSA